MLCGELLNGGTAVPCGLLGLWIPGCVRETSPRLLTSPYLPLLVELLASDYIEQRYIECQTNIEDMDLIRHNQMNSNCSTDLDLDLDNDDSAFLENGLLSFENPNYHLESARFDDSLNSNGTANSLFDEFYQELVVNGGGRGSEVVGGGTRHARRTYAALDLGSMGVNVTQGPLPQNTSNAGTPDNTLNHNLGYCEKTDNDSNEMGGVPHTDEGLNEDIYAVPVKRRQPKDQKTVNQSNDKISDDRESEDKDENLPTGWEKHEDKDGPYYWHIKSGTIQREPPEAPLNTKIENRKSLVKDNDSINNFHGLGNMINTVTRSNTSSALDQELENKRKEELSLKRRSYPARVESESRDKPIRFAVRSLGWTEIAEEDLTPERSSKAVNKCIVDLSLGRNDLLDVVGRWGDGKDLFMDLDEGALKLIDPENLTVLNTQPIHTLRVWGVGRDHGRERDFAYVARDRSTRKFMCHVFRCDIPARTIANTLRDICKKIMIERSLHQNLAKPIDINGRTSLATRPTNLPTEHRRFHRNDPPLVTQSFPTPMEEPKKVLKAQYLGSMQVTAPSGMEVLNDAIDEMVTNTPINQWKNVNVAVAPSMISILTPNDDKLITECRVRYLSFLGIGSNVKQCAFIMHTAQDLFIAHIFNCEPSSGALCKTIEAACKLRYQKCLDAHPQGFRSASSLSTPNGRGIGATLKSLVGSLTGRRNKQGES
ncbi:protein Fe65 homolog isoform X1 [Aphidius gifuensis]|uniref:protein Fe65 homolog isoform X1 n=2 Tax=Aphidius gifuensis TaxID=684658 RepID=UPI001CDBA556|nr:protein Fe65 homolog isoform X1 [Aphidius gifuensis]XP_044017999.1 protein Fe65 homolog isoform X1 [Aphidius gifuensis]